MKTYLVLN